MTIPTPLQLREHATCLQNVTHTVANARQELRDILDQKDDRLIVIVGPCSIHHPQAALQYAKKLNDKKQEYRNTLYIIMRSYVEKSRTAIGWKGLINDPDLNNTFDIQKGLQQARQLLSAINALGMPVASEMVNPLVEPYLSDLISWAAIGARTTESQPHRELASHLSMPVGFKNNTSGNIQVAIDAVETAKQAHYFLHPTQSGEIDFIKSQGNPHAHVVLRGSHQEPNYDLQTLLKTNQLLKKRNLISQVIVDCSHGNSQKNYWQQITVVNELAKRISTGDKMICGVMLESYLTAGKQAWNPNQTPSHDQSITDACLGWAETESILETLSNAVASKRVYFSNCATPVS